MRPAARYGEASVVPSERKSHRSARMAAAVNRAACSRRAVLRLAVLDDDGPTHVAGRQLTSGAVLQPPGASAPLRDIDLARRWIADDGDGDLVALHERQVHAVQRDSRSKVPGPADGIDEPVRRAIGRRLATAFLADHGEAQRIGHNASNRVLDGDIRHRHQIAPAFRGDVFRADATPSDSERSLHRVNGHEGLGTERVRGLRHRARSARRGMADDLAARRRKPS